MPTYDQARPKLEGAVTPGSMHTTNGMCDGETGSLLHWYIVSLWDHMAASALYSLLAPCWPPGL